MGRHTPILCGVPEIDVVTIAAAKREQLRAAAPELAEALKALLAIVEAQQWGERWAGRPHAQCDAANAALRKAGL